MCQYFLSVRSGGTGLAEKMEAIATVGVGA